MQCFYVFVLLAVVGLSTQKSTPEDDHYVAAVVEFIVIRNVADIVTSYVEHINDAASQNADVIVFPELTITNGTVGYVVPINSTLKQYPIPALHPELYEPLLVTISEAARNNSIYVVINIGESVDCTVPQEGEECPEEKVYTFNTNVVFDRNGAVIDRYRKINLFGEATRTPALKPDLGIFTTDFGVTFGHFICFDLMFQVPAIQVVQKYNLTDIIFSTMWFSELPYLTAVQIQQAYAYTMNVNFLGSGANNVRVGSAGSGIYSGKAGALVSIMPGLPTTKLLVARVPKVPGQVSGTYPGPIYDNPADHDNLRLLQDSALSGHITRPLKEGYQEFSITDKDVSCTFKVRISNRTNTQVYYRAFFKDGTNTYSRRELGVVACMVASCKTAEMDSCVYKFKPTEVTTIENLEIEMRTYRKQFNKTVGCDNIEYFPLSFRYNKFPLSPNNYTYTTQDEPSSEQCETGKQNIVSVFQNYKSKSDAKVTLKYKIEGPQNELVMFGIWGRIFYRDVNHNKEVSEEDIRQFNSILEDIYAANSSN